MADRFKSVNSAYELANEALNKSIGCLETATCKQLRYRTINSSNEYEIVSDIVSPVHKYCAIERTNSSTSGEYGEYIEYYQILISSHLLKDYSINSHIKAFYLKKTHEHCACQTKCMLPDNINQTQKNNPVNPLENLVSIAVE